MRNKKNPIESPYVQGLFRISNTYTSQRLRDILDIDKTNRDSNNDNFSENSDHKWDDLLPDRSIDPENNNNEIEKDKPLERS